MSSQGISYYFRTVIPEILNDGQRFLQLWEKSGSFNSFERIHEVSCLYPLPEMMASVKKDARSCNVLVNDIMALTHFPFQLIFQATIRCLMCTEIADDPKLVARCRQLFNQADQLSPAMTLFPWFPSPTMLTRAWAIKQIYDIIVRAMNVRKQSGIPRNDALQMLLDSGEEHFTIVGVSILPLNLPHYSRRYISLVYDGFRNGRGAIDWYHRLVGHRVPRSYRKNLTLYQLPGWSRTLAVIRTGAMKHVQKSRN